jgi:glutathione S-transferase
MCGMADATLIISNRNYSSWSLRGWLLTRMSGLPFTVELVNDADSRAELLLRSSSVRVPRLEHAGLSVWDTLAIAEYLNEVCPDAQMLPEDRPARARCRSISGEMHSGFNALRSALPMNLRAHKHGFPIWSAARADIAAIQQIWTDCLQSWGGPFLFGARPSIADAMYAPVVTRFLSYDVACPGACGAYAQTIMALPDMREWIDASELEVEEVVELELDF